MSGCEMVVAHVTRPPTGENLNLCYLHQSPRAVLLRHRLEPPAPGMMLILSIVKRSAIVCALRCCSIFSFRASLFSLMRHLVLVRRFSQVLDLVSRPQCPRHVRSAPTPPFSMRPCISFSSAALQSSCDAWVSLRLLGSGERWLVGTPGIPINACSAMMFPNGRSMASA